MSTPQNAELMKRLAGLFLIEAREHVETLGAGLIELESATTRDARLPIIENLFRAAHSLKGAARTVNSGEIERFCQKLESGLGEFKSGKREPTPDVLGGFHRDVSTLGRMVESGAGSTEAGGPPQAEVRGAERGDAPRPDAPPEPPQSAVPRSEATVRIAVDRLDAIFVQAEEMLATKLALAERTAELKALVGLAAGRSRAAAEAAPMVRKLRHLSEAGSGPQPVGQRELSARVFDWIEQDRHLAESMSARIGDLAARMAGDRRRFDALADRLLENVKIALMLPFSTILAGFPKMVHDLAGEMGKNVAFVIEGDGIEIDKRILEQVKDPLVHLLRNAVDHGIETPARRAQAGKPPSGNLALRIAQAAGRVVIRISDDGAGIDVAEVRAAAVRTGAISEDEAAALDDRESRHLVFRSGVTSRREVTAISGQGFGMSVVQENVTKLGGSVEIESRAGAGTTFQLSLPMTLATLRGTLVRVADHEFFIPTVHVVRAIRVPQSSVRRIENRDSISVDGLPLVLVRLAEVLGLNSPVRAADGPLTAVVLGHAGAAFVVDEIVGEQEVLAKPLGPLLTRVRNLSGATVSGAGRIVPILSVPDLLRSVAGCVRPTVAGDPDDSPRARRLLVVDDSITARTSLQSILEAAGFDIKTAPDGAAAFDMLRTEPFDLVVSDVEMPRMGGFELTRRIRGEPRLAHLPVVLVSAREAKEDREHGLKAGASAYLAKSGFNQSGLLETLGKLL
jgi:two-component system chemotaxis sensor kinase CheA